jgi:hypothetical protein
VGFCSSGGRERENFLDLVWFTFLFRVGLAPAFFWRYAAVGVSFLLGFRSLLFFWAVVTDRENALLSSRG